MASTKALDGSLLVCYDPVIWFCALFALPLSTYLTLIMQRLLPLLLCAAALFVAATASAQDQTPAPEKDIVVIDVFRKIREAPSPISKLSESRCSRDFTPGGVCGSPTCRMPMWPSAKSPRVTRRSSRPSTRAAVWAASVTDRRCFRAIAPVCPS